MKPLAMENVAGRIEQLELLDGASDVLQKVVRALAPEGSRLKDLLSGSWLGHPVHPPLTDVVIGSWTGALLLDLFGGEGSEDAADLLVAAGIVSAMPTAAAGLSDWAELRGDTRRVGSVHAIGNSTALLPHALSWAARQSDARGPGVALSALGYGVATFSAWLGGHLSFGKGVGVNQTAFEDGPTEWTAVYDESALGEHQLTAAHANGVGLLLVRPGEGVHALVDRCSHRGCSLHEGKLNDDDTVTCPCHGSTFHLNGSVVKGPATARQPSFEVRASKGKIEIRQPASTS